MAAHWCRQRFCLNVFSALALPFSLLLPCFLFCLLLPRRPFFSIFTLPLCLMFTFCILFSSCFSQSPSVSLQSLFLSLWTLYPSIKLTVCLFFFYPLFTLCSPLRLFSLAVSDGSLYSAMSSVGGHAGSIRRTFGSQKLLKTENIWLLSE